MKKDLVRQIVNIIAVVVLVAMNILANALPLNGNHTGDILNFPPRVLQANSEFTLNILVFFNPAVFVFAIWGLIYIGLIAFGVFQALPSQRQNPRLRKIGYLFALSCVANIAWLFCWHYRQLILSEIAMIALLLLLIQIYLYLGTGLTKATKQETWFVRIPFSVYLGWISIATIANTSIVLVDNGFILSKLPSALYAILVMIVGLVLGILMINKRNDWAYTFVLVWGYIGIGVRSLGITPPPNASGNLMLLDMTATRPLVGYTAYLLAGILAILAIMAILKKKE